MKQIEAGLLKDYYYPDQPEFIGGNFKEKQTSATIENVREGDTCIDIGANFGYYTLVLSKLVGNSGKVYSFEPVKETVQVLRKVIQCNGITNVEVYDSAVSDKDGVAELRSCGAGDLDACLSGGIYIPDVLNWERQTTLETVNVISVDTFVKTNNLERVDFVKIDTQGLDILVLEGMKETINKCRPVIICECLGQENRDKITALFKSINYSYQTTEDIYYANDCLVEHLLCKPNN